MTEQSLFLTAMDIADPAERAAFVNKSWAGDETLRRQIEALLAAHDRSGEFLDVPALEQVAAPEETSAEPSDMDVVQDLNFLLPPSRPGSLGRIGHYEVLELLGRGAFGIVFRAFDDVLQRVVAVKVLAPQMAATSPARKRFLREARAAAKVRHENVVQIYATEEQPLPYLVMDFIPGETLQQRLDRIGPLDATQVLWVGRQIAEGLAAAHETGLIHRDVKPSNVLIEAGPHERVKLTDFGLARAADDASVTQSGVVAGTPKYMAPDQARGEHIDCRADLFSLGTVLYTMCSGRPPFRASSTLAVLKRVVEDTPRPIREIIPEVPQWLCDVVAKLHAKDPAERFQTAREVANLLANFEQKFQVHDGPQDISSIPVAKPVRRTGRWLWAAAALACVVPLAGLGVYVLTQPGWQPGTANKANTSPVVEPLPFAPVTTPGQGVSDTPPLAVSPFDAQKAKEHQEAWGKHLGVPVGFTNKAAIDMRVIPPGEFLMGSKEEDVKPDIDEVRENKPPGYQFLVRSLQSEAPQHPVRITKPFAIGKTEVTVGQFRQFIKATQHKTEAEQKGGYGFTNGDFNGRNPNLAFNWDAPGYPQADLAPVWNVSWADAVEFCKWLSKQEGKTYRLPTEAEWEYACRAGTTDRTYWGGDKPRDGLPYAWGAAKSGGKPQPVGQLKANNFGLHDVCGNVWEWCNDWYGETYYKDSPATDPTGPEEPQRGDLTRHRAQRGGGVEGLPCGICSTGRSAADQQVVGFRVVCDLDAK